MPRYEPVDFDPFAMPGIDAIFAPDSYGNGGDNAIAALLREGQSRTIGNPLERAGVLRPRGLAAFNQDSPAEAVRPASSPVADLLFGLNGRERYQLWPEKMVRGALDAPRAALEGRAPMGSDAELHGALDMAGLMGISGPPMVRGGAAGTTGGKLTQPRAEPVAPEFYSAVEHAIRNARQETMTPEQWAGYLRNHPGVKREELEWMGLGDDWKPGKAVTKQEMIDHATEHGVQIKEVKKSTEEGRYTSEEIEDEAWGRTREWFDQEHSNLSARELQRAWDKAVESGRVDPEQARYSLWEEGVRESETKFSEYQLPGGDNYREVLLTLPKKEGRGSPEWQEFDKIRRMEYEDRVATGLQPRYMEFVDRFGLVGRDSPELGNFISSHWDEPNVLVHMRMNDRYVPGVGKALHLEEIQSDWHQQGRKQGYNTGKEHFDKNEFDGLARMTYEQRTQQGVQSRYEQLLDLEPGPTGRAAMGDPQLKSVPDAPFKTTWADLALKKAIRKAAEEGYDAISWTPGEHHNRRYPGRPDKEQRGMEHFYDKMLVDKANALAKKFGGKVEMRELFGIGGKVPVLRLTPEMRDVALGRGFPLFAKGLPFPLEPVDHDPFRKDK